MEKRALLAVIISLLVLYFFQDYFAPPKKPVKPKSGEDSLESFPPESLSPAPEEKGGYPSSSDISASVPEKEVRVETDSYTAIFSTRGAALKSWVLKR